jgi:hypothetical protein
MGLDQYIYSSLEVHDFLVKYLLGSERTERNMRICTIHLAEDKVQRVGGYDPGNGPSVSAGGWEFLHQLRDD